VRVTITMALRSIRELELTVELLARIGLEQAKRHHLPSLYGGRIHYQLEPFGVERWQTPLETAALGYGDCEDLVGYRLYELWRDRVPARCHIVQINPRLFHVLVRYPNGQIEDPSAKLGMPVPTRKAG